MDEELYSFWEWCGIHHRGSGKTAYLTYPELTLDNLFQHAVPKSKMDTLWIINNVDSSTPRIEYCFGFLRGKDNDVICWSKDLGIEHCLSPVHLTPIRAIYHAILSSIHLKQC